MEDRRIVELFWQRDELALKEKGVKKIQLYCDFFLPDGTFPFADEDTIYYPATLIYKPNLWKIHWICWKKTALHPPTATISPYIFNEVAPIESCECVPETFQKMVEGKKLYFHQFLCCHRPLHLQCILLFHL